MLIRSPAQPDRQIRCQGDGDRSVECRNRMGRCQNLRWTVEERYDPENEAAHRKRRTNDDDESTHRPKKGCEPAYEYSWRAVFLSGPTSDPAGRRIFRGWVRGNAAREDGSDLTDWR